MAYSKDSSIAATSHTKPTSISPVMSYTNQRSTNAIVRLSQDMMYAAKTGADTTVLQNELNEISLEILTTSLKKAEDKKAFWINLYNAYTQILLKKNPLAYKKRNQFFKTKQIKIAGKELSFDEIEHGILRKSKIKWSLGYLNKLFPGKTEKTLRVNDVDYRIHFALNCGATSCPPIAFYNPQTINAQLDAATRAYLSGEAEYDSTKNIVTLPALMGWFRHDFGGKKGMITILKKHAVIPADSQPKIKFNKYDWTLSLNNYKKVINE